MFDIQQLEKKYSTFRQEGFDEKWLNYDGLLRYFSTKNTEKEQIGTSFLGNPIYKLSFGTGEKRILIWSQMHGNESSGTRAMFDVINFFEQNSETAQNILSQLTIDFIPMLNPDGANVNTRRNAIGIDINRDLPLQLYACFPTAGVSSFMWVLAARMAQCPLCLTGCDSSGGIRMYLIVRAVMFRL